MRLKTSNVRFAQHIPTMSGPTRIYISTHVYAYDPVAVLPLPTNSRESASISAQSHLFTTTYYIRPGLLFSPEKYCVIVKPCARNYNNIMCYSAL